MTDQVIRNGVSLRLRPQLFGALAGPVAWSIQLMVNYMLAEVACQSNLLSGSLLGFGMAAIIMTGVTLAMLLLTLAGGWVSYRLRRELGEEEAARGRSYQRSAFIAKTGIYLTLIFLLLIVISGIPPLVLEMCA
jgi:hypothetical protein